MLPAGILQTLVSLFEGIEGIHEVVLVAGRGIKREGWPVEHISQPPNNTESPRSRPVVRVQHAANVAGLCRLCWQ